MVSALTTWGIALIGPLLADTSVQARARVGYARADFTVDYDAQTVTCPQGRTSASWSPCTQHGKKGRGNTWLRNSLGQATPLSCLVTKHDHGVAVPVTWSSAGHARINLSLHHKPGL